MESKKCALCCNALSSQKITPVNSCLDADDRTGISVELDEKKKKTSVVSHYVHEQGLEKNSAGLFLFIWSLFHTHCMITLGGECRLKGLSPI